MHATPAEVTPTTESSPDQLGAQLEPEIGHQKGPGWGRWRVLFILAAAMVASVVAFVALRHRTHFRQNLSSNAVGDTARVLRLKGTTEAVQARAILAPMLAGQQVSTLTIIHLTPGGTRVKPGDFLVEFDRQAQMRDFVDKQADYQKLVDQVAQEQAKENAAKAKDETDLKTAEDSLRQAELEAQKAEILSKIDAEKNQEKLEEAKATYDQLRETFDLKRKAAQAAIRILEIQRDRTKQTMDHARSNADLMRIRSPLEGVVVIDTIWKEGTMGEAQEGDQVGAGVPFMQVINPSAMEVRVLANQEDFPSLQIGQTAKVRLDAYPEMVFQGKLDQMAPIAVSGDFSSKMRTFVVIISIQGNDPRLMPDLSAAVDVDLTRQNAGTGANGAEAAASPRSGS